MPRLAPYLLALPACLAIGVAAAAVETSFWTFRSAVDYQDSILENLVVTNHGAVQLGRRVETLASAVEGADVVYSLARTEEGVYWAGTGPEGVLLRISGDDVERVEIPEAQHLFALAADGEGRLLVGTGGEKGRVLAVEMGDDGEVRIRTIFEEPGVRYVWQILPGDDGRIFIATGPEAQVFVRAASGEVREYFQAGGESNALSLALGERGELYVGTEPGGLVWRVDGRTGEGTVLFDAPETEVSGLLRVGDSLYAVTAGPGDARPVPAMPPGEGRLRVPGVEGIIDREEMELPEPPQMPPAEPDPIPLEPRAMPGASQSPGPDAQPPGPDGDDPPEMPEPQPDPRPEPDPRPDPVPDVPPEADRPPVPTPGGFGPPLDVPAGGSAVYRIDLSAGRPGVVSAVLRDSGLLFDLVEQNDRLLIAAGPDENDEPTAARIFQIDPRSDEVAILGGIDALQVTRLMSLGDGRLLLGLNAPGGVAVMSPAFAGEGQLTSEVLDAGAVSTFGNVQLLGQLPEGTEILLQCRSGTAADPRHSPQAWSDWSRPQPARQFIPSDVPQGRFFQFRLTFQSDGDATPAVEQVRVAYLMPNLPPTIAEISVVGELDGLDVTGIVERALEAGESPNPVRIVSWQAHDPNDDPLTFDVYIRRDRRGEFRRIASGLADPAFAWDTRTTGEGIYEIRVVASDARGNPPGMGLTAGRISEPFRVDLTPPRIGDVRVRRDGDDARVDLRVIDAGGIVARLEYLLEGDPGERDNWIRAFPVDMLNDSPQEQYELRLENLGEGEQSLRLRAVDDSGNLAYATVVIPARGDGE